MNCPEQPRCRQILKCVRCSHWCCCRACAKKGAEETGCQGQESLQLCSKGTSCRVSPCASHPHPLWACGEGLGGKNEPTV